MGVRQDQIDTVRRFSRFYTRRIGLLQEGLLSSPYSLTEVRVMHELARQGTTTAAEVASELGLDPGYLSRVVRRLERQDILQKRRSSVDGRRIALRLSEHGRSVFGRLNEASSAEVRTMLAPLSDHERTRVVQALADVERILGAPSPSGASFLLRTHQPGDLGWIVLSHGELYFRERGWDERFEGLVAGIVADFARHHDPRRERCWIAERDGERVGSVLLAQESESLGRLRLLLVDPAARGLGIGRRLVDECLRFARGVGYARVVLHTDRGLTTARRIYEAAGFRFVAEDAHYDFAADHVGEVWEIDV